MHVKSFQMIDTLNGLHDSEAAGSLYGSTEIICFSSEIFSQWAIASLMTSKAGFAAVKEIPEKQKRN